MTRGIAGTSAIEMIAKPRLPNVPVPIHQTYQAAWM